MTPEQWAVFGLVAALSVGSVGVVLVAGYKLLKLLSAEHAANREHTIQLLDRFLSRTFEEHAMGSMIRGETQADQVAEPIDVGADDEAQVEATGWVEQAEAEIAEMGRRATETGIREAAAAAAQAGEPAAPAEVAKET